MQECTEHPRVEQVGAFVLGKLPVAVGIWGDDLDAAFCEVSAPTVQRASVGRKSARKCAKAKRSNRHKPRCTRYTTLKGSFSQAGKAGTNSLRFTGRLNRKPFKPGHYRLTATPTSGKPVRKSFTITKR